MDSFTCKSGINMDGSSDPFYRYKMPAVVVKHEGKGKMKKSVIVNIRDVCNSVGRPTDYVMTYLGQKLNATAKVEKDITSSYVAGHHGLAEVQEQVLNFIQDAVMCRMCHNPETSCHVEGSKKHQKLFLQCKSCGKRSDLDPTDRVVKYMISHPTEDASYGHATQPAAAEIAVNVVKNVKGRCPQCHHKTNKATCSKCGAVIAMEPLAEDTGQNKIEEPTTKVEDEGKKKSKKECPTCHHKTSKPVCGKCGLDLQRHFGAAPESPVLVDMPKDLLGITKLWMKELEASHGEASYDDFMAYMTSEGFTRSIQVDCLGAVVQVIASSVGSAYALETMKLQPTKVAQKTKPCMDMWSSLMEALISNAGDSSAAIDLVVSKVHEGVAGAMTSEAHACTGDTVVVGLLLALNDVDCVVDGLLEACLLLERRSVAMDKFVEFLAEEEEGQDEDEEDDDKSEEES
mmetsp:Transcript_50163/g.93919  ORF Transcript_50163/g.93919 Transcript_50163/m.93919 type:complete len:458 (+) Transcript_50163:92-1465(+)